MTLRGLRGHLTAAVAVLLSACVVSRGVKVEPLNSGPEDHGPRLAMVHAWIWLENPEGLFAADNWAIPFLRLGRDAPPQAAPAAGKPLSPLTGDDDYVARVVRAAAAPAVVDEAALRAVIARAAARVAVVIERRVGATLSAADLATLATEWETLWQGIEAGLPTEAVERVRSQSMR